MSSKIKKLEHGDSAKKTTSKEKPYTSNHKVRKGKPAGRPGPGNGGSQPPQDQRQPGSGALGGAGSPRPSLRPRPARVPAAHPARGAWKRPPRIRRGGNGGPREGWALESLRFLGGPPTKLTGE